MANEAFRAELALIVSCPTSKSGIIFLLKTPQNIDKSSQLYFVRTNVLILSLPYMYLYSIV